MKTRLLNIYLIIIALQLTCCSLFAQAIINEEYFKSVCKKIEVLLNKADIPGLSIVLVDSDKAYIKNCGYADRENRVHVTSKTLFELGSTSKAFTALAVLKLQKEHKISLETNISDYLPWFFVKYKDSLVHITIKQLLHHTSGIPWSSISMIPQGDEPGSLEKTIKKIAGIELNNMPGTQYEFASINYDILGLIIEKVSGQTYESYMHDNIFVPLGLTHTSIGKPVDTNQFATGYKIGFFKPREHNAPEYKGNYPANYVISDAEDMARWLQFQMGQIDHELYSLAQKTHQRDESVAPHGLNSYAMGWEISLSGDGEISHGGLNPDYSSYIILKPSDKIGVVILTNSGSSYTPVIADNVMKLLTGGGMDKEIKPNDGNDKVFSIISVILGIYILSIFTFLLFIIYEILRKKRLFQNLILKPLIKSVIPVIFIIPCLYGIYMLPKALTDFSWEAVLVWTPVSFISMVILLISAMGLTYMVYVVSLFFPDKNKYKRSAPQIIILSILSGLSNMLIILLVTSSLQSNVELKYIVYYFILIVVFYISGRKYVQTSLIRFTNGLVYDIRIKLIEKIFSTSYQRFEKINRGRVYATVNDDVGTVANASYLFVSLITNLITVIGVFMYLATIAFWATITSLVMVLAISTLYYLVMKKTRVFFEKARDTTNVFMGLLNGMMDGFKELSLHRNKKIEFKNDIAVTANEFKSKISTAYIRLVDAFLIGESLVIILLGTVAFAIPKLFPEIELYTRMSFIIVLLYMTGPVTAILGAVPAIMQMKVSWKRIQTFLKEIPANLDLNQIPEVIEYKLVESIKAEGVLFQYKNDNDHENFSVGPIDLEVKKGEILFIIGGNGSGKTTLAKLFTGLYQPDKGKILINNSEVTSTQLSEYFSTVFSPYFLFEKLYDIDLKGKSKEVEKYLSLLDLSGKVEINENKYSTIDLSGGQRKRLALLQCYLENYPIYLFDEWAADQDPEYRKFFYNKLLPKMKEKGKIIIAITHDDHYFDVADKIIKMDLGILEFIKGGYKRDSVLV